MVTPEVAFRVYTSLVKVVGSGHRLGILHGRVPVYDRERVFKAVREDVENGEKVVLVAISVIEVGVDLDFDAGVLELTPYRSLEQTIGRINRRYSKDSEVVVVNTLDETWKMLEEEYLVDSRKTLSAYTLMDRVLWEDVSPVLEKLDEKYTAHKLSTPALVDAYSTPYSKMLAVSLYSLFHLEGTFLEHLLALTKSEYNTRGSLDLLAEVEDEPGNYVRIPLSLAKELSKSHGINVWETGKIPQNILKDHSYIKATKKIEARGLIL